MPPQLAFSGPSSRDLVIWHDYASNRELLIAKA